MKIQSFHFAAYQLPFVRPFVTARQTLTAREGWLVGVRDTDGGWGVGEAAPLEGFGMETHSQAGQTLETLARTLPGTEFALNASSDGVTPHLPGLAEALPPGTGTAVQHGLELALLDLAARRAGLPLAQFLHAAATPAVQVNATLGAGDLEATVRQAKALAAAGFSTLKAKVGDIESDTARGAEIERVRALRQALGPSVRLRLDANGCWSEAEALSMLEALAPLDIEYLEQPLPRENLAGMARLTAVSHIPIAADEAVLSLEEARSALEAQVARVLILKPMALGGILAALSVARLAARYGVPAVLTTTLEGAYARLGAAHAAAALAGLLPSGLSPHAHGLATGALLAHDLVPASPQPEGGSLTLSGEPGLGLPWPRSHLGD